MKNTPSPGRGSALGAAQDYSFKNVFEHCFFLSTFPKHMPSPIFRNAPKQGFSRKHYFLRHASSQRCFLTEKKDPCQELRQRRPLLYASKIIILVLMAPHATKLRHNEAQHLHQPFYRLPTPRDPTFDPKINKKREHPKKWRMAMFRYYSFLFPGGRKLLWYMHVPGTCAACIEYEPSKPRHNKHAEARHYSWPEHV